MIERSIVQNGLKVIIVNQMELWTDVISLQMVDHCYQSRMFGRESYKLGKASLLIPLGNLLSILKMRIKDKDQTSSNVSMLKFTMVRLCLGEHFERSQTSHTIRNAVV